MDKYAVISAKIPDEVYNELALRIPEGERSDFIREAIREKLQSVPRPDRVLQLEQRVRNLEMSLGEIKRSLMDLEVLTFDKDKVNLHSFCVDDTDHKIVDYLLHYKGATTPELADYLKTNRWHILNRLRRLQKRSKTQLGKSLVEYSAAERQGKKKAWWLIKEIVEA
ncbi:MAG TPA: hypothetical protein VJ249_01280 [Candidatus Bathyarchaeia archaeon]|nr:hypothetical protein [Candidatus Bathyarchaeia archaeon]